MVLRCRNCHEIRDPGNSQLVVSVSPISTVAWPERSAYRAHVTMGHLVCLPSIWLQLQFTCGVQTRCVCGSRLHWEWEWDFRGGRLEVAADGGIAGCVSPVDEVGACLRVESPESRIEVGQLGGGE